MTQDFSGKKSVKWYINVFVQEKWSVEISSHNTAQSFKASLTKWLSIRLRSCT